MKKSIIILIALMGLIVTGCQKENVTVSDTPNNPGIPTNNLTAPRWVVDTDYDYSSSMTAVVEVDLSLTYPRIGDSWHIDSADMVGAFCGNQCVGVARPSGILFFVYITSPTPGNNEPVTLRYYSSVLKNIFYGDVAFPFNNGDRRGTVNNPLRPLFRAEE